MYFRGVSTASKDIEKQEVSLLKKDYDNLLWENESLKHQLADLKRMIFGSKSERFVSSQDVSQLNIFGEAQTGKPEVKTEDVSYQRTKKERKERPVRMKIPSHLPRVTEVIEPKEKEEDAQKIGEEVTELLEYSPSKIYVRQIIRPKYAKLNKEGVIIAGMPSLPMPKGNAGASLLAYIMVSKFVDHLPFYRQIQIIKRQNLELSDSTLNGWFNSTTDLLEPLYDALAKELLDGDYLQADESPIGVQDSHKQGALHTGYQWVYRNPVKGLVLFKYHPGRARKAPEEMLKTFSGTLQTDGYTAYKNMQTKGEITLLACMAHARRYFEKALDNDKVRAEEMLKMIQQLYSMERKAKEKGINKIVVKRYRRVFALTVLKQMEEWLKTNIIEVLPKSAIGKAIAYKLNLWPKLKGYIEDGKYEIDNNLIENAIRPLALGRKNYLFAGSHKAAQRAAMMYSFFATCKINKVEPLAWLTDVLNRIPEHKANRLNELLPQNWTKITPEL